MYPVSCGAGDNDAKKAYPGTVWVMEEQSACYYILVLQQDKRTARGPIWDLTLAELDGEDRKGRRWTRRHGG